MTRGKYFIARLLLKLGIGPSERTRIAAATEAHLLRDAESTIGNLIWREVESIDELSSEYWELRKLAKRYAELSNKSDILTRKLDHFQEIRRASFENTTGQPERQNKAAQLEENKNQSERLGRERNSIIEEGLELRRKLNGLTTKLEVLAEEPSGITDLEIRKTRARIEDDEKRFAKIRARRAIIEAKIEKLHQESVQITNALKEEELATKGESENQIGEMGRLNKQLSDIRSEIGAIESDAIPLYTNVGKFLISNLHDSKVKAAIRNHRQLFKLVVQICDSYRRHQQLLSR